MQVNGVVVGSNYKSGEDNGFVDTWAFKIEKRLARDALGHALDKYVEVPKPLKNRLIKWGKRQVRYYEKNSLNYEELGELLKKGKIIPPWTYFRKTVINDQLLGYVAPLAKGTIFRGVSKILSLGCTLAIIIYKGVKAHKKTGATDKTLTAVLIESADWLISGESWTIGHTLGEKLSDTHSQQTGLFIAALFCAIFDYIWKKQFNDVYQLCRPYHRPYHRCHLYHLKEQVLGKL